MRRAAKRRRCVVEEDLRVESDTESLEDMQIPKAIEEYASSSSSTCSSSFPSSSSSSCSLVLSTQEEVFTAAEIPDAPQSPQGACSSSTAMAWSESGEGCSSQREECPSTSEQPPSIESLPSNEIDGKMTALVEFLLLKYRMKEPTTKAEMLNAVIKNHADHFPVIFREACQCLQLVFGIDVKEVDPPGHSYVLATTMGLTYDGMQSEVRGMPKTGLLLLILSTIFMRGNCVPEEVIWDVLSVVGVSAGSEHCMYGDPRKLITEDLVQEQYLEYRRVPYSDPARYEFLWGPRAHAETTKMKVLEFLASFNERDPRSFPEWYEEALRDEEERA